MTDSAHEPTPEEAPTSALPASARRAEKVTPGRGSRIRKRTRDSAIAIVERLNEHAMLSLLGLMALVLIVLFFVGLSVLQPSAPGKKTTLSNVRALIDGRRVSTAQLRDQDKRIVIHTFGNETLWSPYPA